MTEFKGTQGNWTVKFINIQGKCAYLIKEFSGNANEDCANAKLISVAPELLSFIQTYYKFLNLEDQEKAKELIKKATE